MCNRELSKLHTRELPSFSTGLMGCVQIQTLDWGVTAASL